MKLWLDDLRAVPYGYVGCKTVQEAEDLILLWEQNGLTIEILDLDYDLSFYDDKTGMDLLKWLYERESFYPVEIHSTHFQGVNEMENFIAWNWP